MKFRTEIISQPESLKFTHQNQILSIGSCFAGNVGDRLVNSQFNTVVNPFGILFNPVSIAKNIQNAIRNHYDENLTVQRDSHYYNFDYPSQFLHNSKAGLSNLISNAQHDFNVSWNSVDRLILTFGTAWVYRYKKLDQIVANCHKIPQIEFEKELLDLSELISLYKHLFSTLIANNPNLEIVLTVSPVRHIKNGIHEDKLSKSILLLLCDHLEKFFPNVRYFPAYELIIDDLRDYRFYKEDLIHPTDQAIDYVYSHFKSRFFNEKTVRISDLSSKVSNLKAHNNMNGTEVQINQINRQIRDLQSEIDRLKIEL